MQDILIDGLSLAEYQKKTGIDTDVMLAIFKSGFMFGSYTGVVNTQKIYQTVAQGFIKTSNGYRAKGRGSTDIHLVVEVTEAMINGVEEVAAQQIKKLQASYERVFDQGFAVVAQALNALKFDAHGA